MMTPDKQSQSAQKLTIAIDGPAAAGKSTLAKLLAKRLDYLHLDTGAMYRAVGWKADKLGIPLDDIERVSELARNIKIRFVSSPENKIHLIADGEDITTEIRTRHAGELASRVSAIPAVRRILVALQRQLGADGGVVAEGRDMQTVVFPQAEVKIFLTASVKERAKRRLLELREKAIEATLAEIESEMEKRDTRDASRADSPLRAAPDAIEVNTDNKTIDQMLDEVLAIVADKQSRLEAS